MNWRRNVSPLIKEHLENQIRESFRHKNQYLDAKNRENAQLWIAVANLSKQISDLSLKLKNFEKAFSGKEGIKDDSKSTVKVMRKF